MRLPAQALLFPWAFLLCLLPILLAQEFRTVATPDELTKEQIEALKRGETILLSREILGAKWPQLIIYKLVNASPREVFDLFTDYASAPSYTPGMLAAEVVNQPAENIKDVRYTVKVPVLSRISYVVRNEFEETDGHFEVRWHLLESPVASKAEGGLSILPWEGLTLLRYHNLVTPTMPMAGVLKKQAANEAKTTVEAIAAEAARRSSLKALRTEPAPSAP